MMWLKRLDWLSRLVPGRLLRKVFSRTATRDICILRPGGLGDLVVLSRACLELGIDPRGLDWFLESRNAPWFDYLHIPYQMYHSPRELARLVLGSERYRTVINTEQYHGLASIFCGVLVSNSGEIFGFNKNPRADLYDHRISYDNSTQHELQAFRELLLAGVKLPRRDPLILRNEIVPAITQSESDYVICGIGGLQDPKRLLSAEVWRGLIERACAEQKKVILVGSRTDQEFAAMVTAACSSVVENKVGILPFADVIQSIRGAKRYYGVDSGLLHIADFFAVPSTAIFTAEKINQWRPLTAESLLLRSDLSAQF